MHIDYRPLETVSIQRPQLNGASNAKWNISMRLMVEGVFGMRPSAPKISFWMQLYLENKHEKSFWIKIKGILFMLRVCVHGPDRMTEATQHSSDNCCKFVAMSTCKLNVVEWLQHLVCFFYAAMKSYECSGPSLRRDNWVFVVGHNRPLTTHFYLINLLSMRTKANGNHLKINRRVTRASLPISLSVSAAAGLRTVYQSEPMNLVVQLMAWANECEMGYSRKSRNHFRRS